MTWAFNHGDRVYIANDELTHVIDSANPNLCRWVTVCHYFDDIDFRYTFKPGVVLRTTDAPTCMKCVAP